MPVADIRGQRVYYEDSGGGGGGGVPIVLSHGFLMDQEMFEPQVRALAPTHRVITWDERGHGRTVSTPEPFTYWDSAEDLAGLLDHLGVERAVVGGMSQGGIISMRFALRHPDRTAGLVLIDTQPGVEDPDKVPQYDAMHEVWATSGPNDQLLGMVAAIIIGNERPEAAPWQAKWRTLDAARLTPIYRTLMDRDDITDRVAEITAPAIVIHGTDDVAIDISRAEELCGQLSGCRGLVRVESAGHASNLTHPDPVNRAIEEFLVGIRQPV